MNVFLHCRNLDEVYLPSSDQEHQRLIKQADEKLFDVFKTIFALPGIMTLHKWVFHKEREK